MSKYYLKELKPEETMNRLRNQEVIYGISQREVEPAATYQESVEDKSPLNYFLKYVFGWLISIGVINHFWQMWEEAVYGEVIIDKFDGFILYALGASLMINWLQYDLKKYNEKK